MLQHVLPAPGPAAMPPHPVLFEARAARAALAVELATQQSPGGEKVALLVRLPAQTHSRLKRWCDTHGHSMNVVVRGLVDQFLDGQPPEQVEGSTDRGARPPD